jgi:hypothetical protein
MEPITMSKRFLTPAISFLLRAFMNAGSASSSKPTNVANGNRNVKALVHVAAFALESARPSRIRTRTQECLIMNKSIFGLAVTVLLTMTVHRGFAAEAVHVPATPHAAASTDLIARADRALRDYVAACSTGDDEAIARIVTNDAVVEYGFEEPGTYLGVEAAALNANCSGNAKQAGAGAYISNLWIFPTNDSNAVFVQFTTSSDIRSPAQLPDSKHLALLEMRGDRIFKMRNFSAEDRADVR